MRQCLVKDATAKTQIIRKRQHWTNAYKGFVERRGKLYSRYSVNSSPYVVGEIYSLPKLEGKPRICKRGYHVSKNLIDVMNFYRPTQNEKMVYYEVQVSGKIAYSGPKMAAQHLRLVRRLRNEEVAKLTTGVFKNQVCGCSLIAKTVLHKDTLTYHEGDFCLGVCNKPITKPHKTTSLPFGPLSKRCKNPLINKKKEEIA